MFQAKMIAGKFTKNSIKNLGFREKKVTASGNISS